MKNKKTFFFLIFLIIPVLISSCENGINIFTLQDDVQLGQDLNQQIQNSPQEFPIYTENPAVKNYINSRIFQHVLQSSQIEHKDVFPYQFEIIDNDSVFNAFALPGGYIYLYTGLLAYLESEAALAGVVAHEIAHAEQRHSTERLTASYGVSTLLSIVLGENPSQVEEIAANLFTGLAFLANSRSDESEADEFSFKYLRDTRYYPGGVKFFFEHMIDDGLVSGNSSQIEIFLSTHPAPEERVQDTNTRLQELGLPIFNWNDTGNNIFHDEYIANIKSKL